MSTMSTSRLQLALNVSDLEEATGFYAALFGVEPHKTRPGYVNFAIADPPLKLVLFENPEAGDALNHLGVELADADQVEAATERFGRIGLTTRTSKQELCCHAVQEKVYVEAPDVPLGSWEYYTVLDENPDSAASDERRVCCGQDSERAACCA